MTKGTLWLKYEPEWTRGREYNDLDKDFSRFFYHLNLDLETLFKVTVHPLPKGTMWVKHDPDWAKGREDML